MAKRKKEPKPVIFEEQPTRPDVIVPPLPPEPALTVGEGVAGLTVGEGVAGLTVGEGPIVLEPLRDDAALVEAGFAAARAAAERAWAATAYASATGERAAVEAQEAAWEADVMAYPAEEPPLRTDGPTLEEWVAAGYQAEHYPPHGYTPRTATLRQPDTYILSRVEPNPGHIGNYPASQWSPSKAASDGGGPGTYEIRAIMAGEEHSRSYIIVHPDGRVETKS